MNRSPSFCPPLPRISTSVDSGSTSRIFASCSMGTAVSFPRSGSVVTLSRLPRGKALVFGAPQVEDLLAQGAAQELLGGQAQVHALDAHSDLVGTGAVVVEAYSVEAFLAVGVVVEPTSGAGLRQSYGLDLLDQHPAA